MNTSNKPHKHWRLMRDYAQDAQETDRPWDRWQYRYKDGDWQDETGPFIFYTDFEYRRKPRTININGIEVPEPMREKPEDGTKYYMPMCDNEVDFSVWQNSMSDNRWLSWGVCHLTREAAELHAKALLSFTKKEETK